MGGVHTQVAALAALHTLQQADLKAASRLAQELERMPEPCKWGDEALWAQALIAFRFGASTWPSVTAQLERWPAWRAHARGEASGRRTLAVAAASRATAEERVRLPVLQLPEGARVVLVEDGTGLQECARALRDPPMSMVALDAEWPPTGRAARVSSGRSEAAATLLQIATWREDGSAGGVAYLLDLPALASACPMELVATLGGLFSAKHIVKLAFDWSGADARHLAMVGVVHDQVAEVLNMVHAGDGSEEAGLYSRQCWGEAGYGGLDGGVRSLLDIRTVWQARRPGVRLPGGGLAGLVADALGRQLDKAEQCSDWSARPLRAEQLEYAALDAVALLQLQHALEEGEPSDAGKGRYQLCVDLHGEPAAAMRDPPVVCSSTATASSRGKATPEQLWVFLDSLGIKHVTQAYAPDVALGDAVSLAGSLPRGTCKNLFLIDRCGSMWLVIALAETLINLKKLRDVLGSSGPLSFGKENMLHEILGISSGCVSVFALLNDRSQQPRRVKVVVDAQLCDCADVHFHPLRNDAITTISYHDMFQFIAACGHDVTMIDFSEMELVVPLEE
ncbi:hypothetical protein CYMTET_34987 [Cymbomonas tetramitiformis]|uniref:Uncharacterized protein n=1 Tax=Cymbomonas tetramitiformis TaxID=36881 RepID=A0AAE0FA74_9CHLO|nr:hypothetical protein CYMTET_34987 [Cymbomonas tetramitiformis]